MSKLQVKILIDYAKYKRLIKMAEDLHERKSMIDNKEKSDAVNSAENMEGSGLSDDMKKNKNAIVNDLLKMDQKTGLTPPPEVHTPILKANEEASNSACSSNKEVSSRKQKSSVPKDESSIIERSLMEKTPKCYKTKMRKFLKKLKLHQDVINYNSSNELIIDGSIVPNTNFSLLTLRLISKRKHSKQLKGEREYLQALKKSDLINDIVHKEKNKKEEEPATVQNAEEKESNKMYPWYFVGQ